MSTDDNSAVPRPAIPDALEGFYSMAAPDADVPLYSGVITVEHAGERIQGTGDIVFCWRPHAAPEARVSFEATSEQCRRFTNLLDVVIEAGSYRCTGLVSRGNINTDGATGVNTVKLKCRLRDSEHGTAAPLHAVLFHVMNFDDCIGTAIGHKKIFQHGRTSLEADGWAVTIDNAENIRDLVEELEDSRGGAITHVGKLQRIDGGDFSAESAKDILWALSHLMSFAMGHHVNVVLPVGLDNSGVPVWRGWHVPKSCKWAGPVTWFNNQRPEALRPLFAELLTQWKDKDIREAHQLALYWYLLAVGEARPDAALVTAFTCLELIAWFWLVEKETLYSASAFDSLPAKEKLRRLLTRVGVPEAIPTELAELGALASTETWGDGPEAVATLRNVAVHPKKRSRIFDAPERARNQALSLALWYIELSLLRFLEFDGTYINRLKRRSNAYVEKLPWAT